MVQGIVLQPFPLLRWFQESRREVLGEDWKLLLSLPPPAGEQQEGRGLLQLLRLKFRRSLGEQEDQEQEVLVQGAREVEGCRLRLCVRELGEERLQETVWSEEARRRLLGGTTGLLFLHLQEHEVLQEAQERLRLLLTNKPRLPAPPLLLLSSLQVQEAEAAFSLKEAVKEGQVSSYQVITVTTDILDTSMIAEITEGVRNLVVKRPADPLQGLARKPLRDFVEDFLSEGVFSHWLGSRKARRCQDLPDRSESNLLQPCWGPRAQPCPHLVLRPPDEMLELYHSGLEHLQEVLRDPQLLEVGEVVTSLLLPPPGVVACSGALPSGPLLPPSV